MKWIGPLFKNAGGWEAFVAFEKGTWFVDKSSPIKIGEGKSGVMLLPLLQKGYGENFKTQIEILQKGLASVGQNPEFAYQFPFHVPVLTAYKYMPNWCNSAVDWLVDIQLSKEHAMEIFDACHTSVISQGVRKATIKHINKWSKERGFQLARPQC